MTSPLSNELLFAARALLRDTLPGHGRLRALRRHESMSGAQLAALQARLLHQTLRTAIARLPFYAHIRPDFPVAAAPEVLREAFPVIGKETLIAHRAGLYPNGGARRAWQAAGKTSGTTGAPLEVFRSLQSLLMEQAFVKRHWAWGGYRDGMVRASLRGDLVTGVNASRPPFWFWNRYNRQLLVSSRHLTEAHADAIIDRLEALAPAMLQAYPSTAFTLAGLLERRKRRLRIPVIFTASEPLYQHQRALIGDRLGATIMDMYGMAERAAFACECEHGQLHVNPELRVCRNRRRRRPAHRRRGQYRRHHLPQPRDAAGALPPERPHALEAGRLRVRARVSDDRAGQRKTRGRDHRQRRRAGQRVGAHVRLQGTAAHPQVAGGAGGRGQLGSAGGAAARLHARPSAIFD